MKHILLTVIFTLALALPLPAVDITYQVNSGAKSASLTNSYDMNAASTASSDIDLRSHPSITSQTTVHAVGEDNNIEITTSADDGMSSSSASVRILDNVSTAQISTSASAANSTSASVTAAGTGAQAGLIKGESGGRKKFCAFTGDFNASSDTANGAVSVSSIYENPLSNIYIVTKNPTPCQGATSDTIQAGVDKATHVSGKPDYVFVDYGTYTGAAMVGKSSLTLMGVWGADDTVVTSPGGDVISASESTKLTIEGFTVTGGFHGIGIYNTSRPIMVRDNTAIENKGAGIYVESSGGTVEVAGNTVSDNKGYGIHAFSPDDVNVSCNNVSNSGGKGIYASSLGGNATASGNTVSNSGTEGIYVRSSSSSGPAGNVTATENTVSNSGMAGIYVESFSLFGSAGNATASGNTVSNSGWGGIYAQSYTSSGPAGNVTASENTVTNSAKSGIFVESFGPSGSAGNATASGNTVSNSGEEGIYVKSTHGNVNIKGNTVTENLTGVTIGGTPIEAKVNQNNIYSNTTGLENATSGHVDATNNWWGPGGTGGPGEGGNNDVVNSGGGSTTSTAWSHVRF